MGVHTGMGNQHSAQLHLDLDTSAQRGNLLKSQGQKSHVNPAHSQAPGHLHFLILNNSFIGGEFILLTNIGF